MSSSRTSIPHQFALCQPHLSSHQVTHFETDLRPHRAARMGPHQNPMTKTNGLKTGSDRFSQFGQPVRALPETVPLALVKPRY